jgi:uncharacterized protein YtpQ (UPF0354 family)
MPDTTVTVSGDLTLNLRRPDGRGATVNLANLYNAYVQEPARRDELVTRLVTSVAEPCKACGRLDRTNIVPVIKSRLWLEHLRAVFRAQAGANAPDPLYEDFNSELVIVYAEDSGGRTRYLSTAENTGIARAALRALAVENLRRLLPKVEMRLHDNVFGRITAGGDYEASLLLLDEVWSNPQIKVNGDIVVAIPAKDILLITGSRNRKGMQTLRNLAANIVQKESYRLVETLFVYRNGRFVTYGR